MIIGLYGLTVDEPIVATAALDVGVSIGVHKTAKKNTFMAKERDVSGASTR